MCSLENYSRISSGETSPAERVYHPENALTAAVRRLTDQIAVAQTFLPQLPLCESNREPRTDEEISELTDYIMTVYQNPAIDRESMPLSGYSQGEIELGKQLFYGKYSCQGCHILDSKNDKGYIGPTLTQVGFAIDRSLDVSVAAIG